MGRIEFENVQIPTDGTYEMPFGMHKGLTIEEIPSGYLSWLSRESTNPGIANAARHELNWRSKNNAHFDDNDNYIEAPDESEDYGEDFHEVPGEN